VAARDGRHLYAVLRAEPYRVVTFAIDATTGALRPVASAQLPDSMAYATLDGSGRWLLSASYGGSKLAVSGIETGGLLTAAAHQVVPTGRNAHAVVAERSNRYVYASNLGSDQVMQLAFDGATGTLQPLDPAHVAAQAGDGPRHLVVHPGNGWLYVLCELTGMVLQLAIDAGAGRLRPLARVASVPAEAGLVPGRPRGGPLLPDADRLIWCADIAITPDGRHLYTTERTTSRISQLSLDPATGTPRLVTTVPTAPQPRGIRIDSSGAYLVASGERADEVRLYRIDATTGALTDIGRYGCGRGANWVEIVDAG
jgi:6-phosphogluconolactonase